jgi:hypothetical protein
MSRGSGQFTRPLSIERRQEIEESYFYPMEPPSVLDLNKPLPPIRHTMQSMASRSRPETRHTSGWQELAITRGKESGTFIIQKIYQVMRKDSS